VNAVDILKYGHLTVLQPLDGFSESAWDTPGACGVWSVKDIIAHLASYEQVLVDVLTTFLGGGSTPSFTRFTESGNQFNDSEVAVRKEKTVKEVLEEFNDTHDQVVSMVVQISPRQRKREQILLRKMSKRIEPEWELISREQPRQINHLLIC